MKIRASFHVKRFRFTWLSAGISFSIICSATYSVAAQSHMSMEKDQTAGSIVIHAGKQLLMHYQYAKVPFKPYVKQFLTPGGINILRDAPPDHLHHHGLMYAIGVDGVDFWSETKESGIMVDKGCTDLKTGDVGGLDYATFTQRLDWINPADKKVLIQEIRTITVYDNRDLKVSLLTWKSHFELPSGKESASLWGRKYFGLGARFLQSMDKNGRFQNAEGKTGVAGTSDVRSPWCAYTAKTNGKSVTIAMFDHPKNFRHPATWFTMGHQKDPFAYMTNTLNLEKEPFKITPGNPLLLQYGVALWDGDINTAQIEKLYQRWITLASGRTAPAWESPRK